MALLAAAALCAAGCGGGDEQATQTVTQPPPAPDTSAPDTTAQAPTTSTEDRAAAKVQFVRKADAVCRDAREKLRGVSDSEVALPLVTDAIRRLRALEPKAPQPPRLRFGQYVSSLERQRDLLAGGQAGTSAGEVERQARRSQRLAIRAGLTDCSIGTG